MARASFRRLFAGGPKGPKLAPFRLTAFTAQPVTPLA
jgi:hypothetical protein